MINFSNIARRNEFYQERVEPLTNGITFPPLLSDQHNSMRAVTTEMRYTDQNDARADGGYNL